MNFYFYSPIAFEKWDYRNPTSQGIGGSETAHIEMALRLAKRGHNVVSYSPLPKDTPDRQFGGVSWLDLSEIKYNQPGIWVISRYPQFVDKIIPSKKTRYWLVMQDEIYPKLTKKRAEKFDLLLPLCPEHARITFQRHSYMKGKIVLSSNGLRKELVEEVLGMKIKRNPKKLMYASSPDRGLKSALEMFKKAYEMDPELEFHTYYGFDNMNKIKAGPLEKYFLGQIIEIEKLLNQPGVINHGRISQIELYKEWASAGIWFYPTNFFETSCITSMESQALGAIPITAPIGALSDNVMFGIVIPGEVKHDPLTKCRYAYDLVKLANSPAGQDRIRPQMMKMAVDRFDWENFVNQYEELANG